MAEEEELQVFGDDGYDEYPPDGQYQQPPPQQYYQPPPQYYQPPPQQPPQQQPQRVYETDRERKERLKKQKKEKKDAIKYEEKSVKKGVIAAVLNALKFIVIPLVLINIIAGFLNGMTDDNGDRIIDVDQWHMREIMVLILLVGIIIAVFSFLKAYYPRGTKQRLAFSEVRTALSILYIFIMFGGPLINFASSDPEFQFGIELDISKLMLLMVIAIALFFPYYVAEYVAFSRDRREYEAEQEKKQLDQEELQQLRQQTGQGMYQPPPQQYQPPPQQAPPPEEEEPQMF